MPHPASMFFDLSGFDHAELFLGNEDCWDALGSALKKYLVATIRPGIRGIVHEGAYLVDDDIEIGEGSFVEAGAYIQGPTIIGRNCQVRHGAYIRGPVVVGDSCVIGHASELKASVLLNDAKAGHFAYVGDSILGNGVNLGAGTKLANFKLTGKEIVLRGDHSDIHTRRRKLGAILGDGCQTGCNSVTSPGTLLGPGSFVYPCVVVPCGIYAKQSRFRG